MPSTFPSYTLSLDVDIPTIRRTFIRDMYSERLPPVSLSTYNSMKKQNFISDADMQTICDRVVVDQQEELESAWREKNVERVAYGDSTTTAATQADTIQKQILYRLVSAECFTLMLNDATFRASLFVPGSNVSGAETVKQMEDAIEEWLAWDEQREGQFGFVALERL